MRQFLHFVTLYLVLVAVGASTIHFITRVSWDEALSTAALACAFKVVAVRLHHYLFGLAESFLSSVRAEWLTISPVVDRISARIERDLEKI
jgi:hypothetical protein